MKKQYISPETLSQWLNLDNLMQSGSITTVDKGDLTNDINVSDGETSGDADSRRSINVWEDEEEDY